MGGDRVSPAPPIPAGSGSSARAESEQRALKPGSFISQVLLRGARAR
ncbi:hypothetical protein AMELA_G00224760 [Ameiurus melas]|uniref:Uncharacterized protein n=1 Tax=Ameiurus melas TaxID=219545 RepID=A0A7J6A399_AMEME|nr:hypothetical protein AMELA_G00224760 [Ameiurus melas]